VMTLKTVYLGTTNKLNSVMFPIDNSYSIRRSDKSDERCYLPIILHPVNQRI
jgi:hypothetical protein